MSTLSVCGAIYVNDKNMHTRQI